VTFWCQKWDWIKINWIKMEQNKTEQILELILARMDANERKMDSNHERMMAKMDAWLGKTEACREATEDCEERTKACLEEEKEPAPEEPKAVAESGEVLEGATDEETSGGTEDRTGEQRLAMRRHRQQKKRAQVNGEPRQKFAAARGRFTRRAVPAMRKGHVRKGPGMKCRRSGIRGPGKTSGTRIVKRDQQRAVGCRSPLKRHTKGHCYTRNS
jgi:hypothetical protein